MVSEMYIFEAKDSKDDGGRVSRVSLWRDVCTECLSARL